MSKFSTAHDSETDLRTRMECGVCWTVYDPAEGDPLGRAAPGTPFAALPDDWCCPTCDAPPAKFLRLDDDR
ncbi:rubredoxin [Rhodopseudomonas palustris]|uniref:rubredoxin n=1 Tax=Rhodopseudomonas palustris TaxID=1076 RepID=UPI0021F25B11|nr:rubredoxin [Rhodopseudomonas palustris]UYO54810.1 rubredoxin [Rhodopseudomonas palustris]